MNQVDSGKARLVFAAGTIVAGKYRVEKMLAEGGMGLVVAATHLHLDQSVALKFLRGDVSSEWDALARFTREARAAAQLRSEHVAHVLDAGLTEDGTPYMVMEYLEGHSLARSLQASGPLDVASAVEYVIQACEGLAEAHARGIVHRDIKPYNLFLVEPSPGWHTIKILDFGISKFAFSDPSNVVTGVIIGSPCYMSPEQLRSTATVDHRTDIWSLGATLHELIAGKAAFDASQTLPELVAAILERPAARLHDLRPEVPRELSAVVDRCLAKDRDARFSSTGEVAMALLPFAPPRARALAERAASMKPAFRVGDSESEIASGMPLPAWNGFANHREGRLASEDDETNPAIVALEAPAARDVPTDAPTALDMTAADELSGADSLMAISRSRAFRWLGVTTLVAAAIVVFVTIQVAGTEPGARSSPAGKPAPPSVAVPALTRPEATEAPTERLTPLPSMAPAADMLELMVRASPPSARITVDGVAVADNPFRASYPKDGEPHHIAVRADGYESKMEDVSLGQDTVLTINLNPRSPPRPSTAVLGPGPSTTRAAPRRSTVQVTPSAGAQTPTQTPMSAGGEVDAAGGRMPLRPIETRDPYGKP